MIIFYLTFIVSILISVLLCTVTTECLLALFLKPTASKINHLNKPYENFSIIIPAHNEGDIIGKTLEKLITEIDKPDMIFLVADNCSDNTADIARSLGVNVLERNDNSNIGKGFALAYGIDYILNLNLVPKIVIFLDADCEIKKESIIQLLYSVYITNKPAQAVYLMRIAENATIKQKIAGFAWLVKNKIRPLAINLLSLPVTLTGTGMAFPIGVFDFVRLAHGNIVEDMQLGIDCAIQGYPPILCSTAEVFSNFPAQKHAEVSQRTRWEHGHLQTIIQQCPILIKKAIQKNDWRLFGLALDIAVPPLSLLILISLFTLFSLTVFLPFTENTSALVILLCSFIYFITIMLCVLKQYGKSYVSFKELLLIPSYVLSKLYVYYSFLLKRQKNWVRTDRNL